jgi:hypothetical protein
MGKEKEKECATPRRQTGVALLRRREGTPGVERRVPRRDETGRRAGNPTGEEAGHPTDLTSALPR